MDELQTNKIASLEREKYWNDGYVSYWMARVKEANMGDVDSSSIVVGDAKTSTDDLYVDAIKLLQICASGSILELGCGFGRSLSKLCKQAYHVTAVDISEQMIKVAKESCKEKNITFYVSPSEKLPLPDNSFDFVVCFAAFDAMYQMETLIEINRVCKVDAKVLITGKNDDYFSDDFAALDAEAGARSKGHPNYFTDVKSLVQNLDKFGFEIVTQKYYLRRGDFSRGVSLEVIPHKFYEYLFILKKNDNCNLKKIFTISSELSKTFYRTR